MAKRPSPRLREWALDTAPDKLQQIRRGDDAHDPTIPNDYETANRPPTKQVRSLPHCRIRFDRDHVAGHELAHQTRVAYGRAMTTTEIAVRNHADHLCAFEDHEMMNAVRPHQRPCVIGGRCRRDRGHAPCHDILDSHKRLREGRSTFFRHSSETRVCGYQRAQELSLLELP